MTNDTYDACIDKLKEMFSSPKQEILKEILNAVKDHASKNDAETHWKGLNDLIETFKKHEHVLNPKILNPKKEENH